MSQFLQLARGIDTLPPLLELQQAPHLWDEYSVRRTYEGTPHTEMTDIFVRFRAREDLDVPARHNEEFRNVFWPAWQALPSLRPIVFGLMTRVSAVELGSILITKLPPDGKIAEHTDAGWSANWFNTKVHLTLMGQSVSQCGGESVAMVAGDVWTFNNLIPHSVANSGQSDRIVVIVSMRCEQ